LLKKKVSSKICVTMYQLALETEAKRLQVKKRACVCVCVVVCVEQEYSQYVCKKKSQQSYTRCMILLAHKIKYLDRRGSFIFRRSIF